MAKRVAPHSQRVELVERLRARRTEIEGAMRARTHAIADPGEVSDLAYEEGLEGATRTAIDYALEAIEGGADRAPPLPAALLSQARLAARRGVALDAVLRRYVAGYALLGDFIARESEDGGLDVSLTRLLPSRAAVFDRLIAAVSAEYEWELGRQAGSSAEQRRAERVQRLLAGEPLDSSELRYDFDRFHLGLVAQGAGCEERLRDLARPLDCRELLVAPRDGVAWAWIGTRCPLDPADLDLERVGGDPALAIALGEPADGLAGWRLTHRQAAAALEVAQRDPGLPVRYRDVAILASALKDDVLATSLHELYIAPLREQRDGGEAAIETLRAYFSSDRNASSAAALLGVNRNTITERLRAIEAAIGRPLTDCGPELETALDLAELNGTATG